MKQLYFSYFNYLKVLISGIFMGVAGMIPGVSSGTVAVVTGTYPDLIQSLKIVTTKKERKQKAIFYLVVLFSGLISATFLAASFMETLIINYPIFTNLFFIGLIVGTLPMLFRKANLSFSTPTTKLVSSVFAFLLSILFVVVTSSGDKEATEAFIDISFLSISILFLAGFVSGGIGLVPGVSGSMVLLSLGLYTTLIAAINQFHIVFLISLALGAGLGFVIFSKLIYILLNQYKQITYFAICGLLTGSAIILFPEAAFKQELLLFILSIALIILGFCLSYFIGGEKKHAQSNYI